MKRAIMTITFSIIFFLLLIIIPNTVHAEEYFDSNNKYMELHTIERWGTDSYNQLKYTFKVYEGDRYRITIQDYKDLKNPEVTIRYLEKLTPNNGTIYDYELTKKSIELTETDSYGNNYYDFTAVADDVLFELYINFQDDSNDNKDILYDKVHVYHEATYPVPTITDLKIETTPSTAKLTWLRTDEQDDEYEIFKVKAKGLSMDVGRYRVEEKMWEKIGKTKDNTYTVKDLDEDTRYVFSIVTCRKRNGKEYQSVKTLPVSATTKVSPLPTVKNLRVVENTQASIKIEWNPIWDTIEPYHYYQIELYDYEKKEWKVYDCKDASYSFHPTEGKKYKYRVCARIDSGWNQDDTHSTKYFGDYSNEIEFVADATTPKKVTGLYFSSQNESTITLRWDSTEFATKYEIDIFDEKTSEWKVLGNTSRFSRYYQVNNLQKDKEYKFRVRGIRETILEGNLEGVYSDELTVTLNTTVENVTLESTTLKLEKGSSKKLTATISPQNATNKEVEWKSEDEDIATVSDDGTIKALKVGDTTITVTTKDGGKKATCKVTVVECLHSKTTVHNEETSTCIKQGHGKYTTCNKCGKVISGNNSLLPLANHNYGDLIAKKDPVHKENRLEAGMKAHYVCSVCGKYFNENHKEVKKEDLTIEAPTHQYGDWTTNTTSHWKECKCGKIINEAKHSGGIATCAKRAKCKVCGVEYGKLDSTNHVNKETRNAKKATCTEKGYTGDIYCKDCNKKISSGTEIPAIGHKGGKATSTKGAICERCGVEYTKKLEEEKHKYPSNITFQDNYLKAGKTITIRQNANGKSVSFISLLADIVKSAIENKFPGIKVASKLTGNIGTGKVIELSNGDNITVIYKGDVNGDGRVSITDAAIMVRASNGKLKLTPAQEKAGDIGGVANKVNASDAAVVVRLLNGGKNAEKAYNKIAEYMPEDM